MYPRGPCRRTAKYQVRRYKPFLVAQTQLDNLENLPSTRTTSSDGTSQQWQQSVSPATAGMKAFNALATYIFGGNAAGERLNCGWQLLQAGRCVSAVVTALLPCCLAHNDKPTSVPRTPPRPSGSKMAMTTPVFTSTDGTMQFVVDAAAAAQQVRLLAALVVGAQQLRAG
jgi:hypothetical protein